uniref:Uncharacterized protein n=1 Tax=Nelumbo nucifera TaxID=4432 RepID=A0A822Z5M5_NELNU|nr:TPA_asm: hypothetical protein HUJ06_014470 [Nelumbo nucifera]
MARFLLSESLGSTTQTSLGVAALFLCALALFMCASHSWGWRRWRGCYGHSYDPVIQLNTDAAILTTKRLQQVQPGDSSMVSRELCVWKKNILMGEKCQLPEFSGVIVYDSAGNIVPRAKTSHAGLSRK